MTLIGKLKMYAAVAGGLLLAVAVVFLRVFHAGRAAERVEQIQKTRKQEVKVNKRIDDAHAAGNHVRDTVNVDSARLRDDDGYKRRTKRPAD